MQSLPAKATRACGRILKRAAVQDGERVVPTLLVILALALGALLIVRGLKERASPRGAPGPMPMWAAALLAAVAIAVLAAASGGRLLAILLPAAAAAALLLRGRWKDRGTDHGGAPAEVVETDWFRAYRDHPTAPMDAVLRHGQLQGRRLSELGLADLVWLHQQIDDDDSVALLERFLNQEFPGWRDRVERAATALLNEGMTTDKAREILGLSPGAGPEEIIDAHRRLIQRLHPDRGGSDYLATLLNRAKSVLLERR
jgi:hypothetical protein